MRTLARYAQALCALTLAACANSEGEPSSEGDAVGGASTGGSVATAGSGATDPVTGGTGTGTGGVDSGGATSGSGGATGGSSGATGGSGGATSGSGGATGDSGGATGGSGGGEPIGGWLEQWSSASSLYLELWERGSNIATPGTADALAEDGKALELMLQAGASASPGGGVEAQSLERYQYGVFASRLRTADCTGQPNAGVVTGLFTYFNDGSDSDGDGLPDNSEIDFEWLCAEPEVIYLTMWTDYRSSDDAHQRVTRSINLRTGQIRQTCAGESFGACEALTGEAAQPTRIDAIADYDSAARYYEYGFEWRADRVTWWMREAAGATPIILWDYRGPAVHIPAQGASFLANVWHTNNWPPPGAPGAVESPTAPVSGFIDWMRYGP